MAEIDDVCRDHEKRISKLEESDKAHDIAIKRQDEILKKKDKELSDLTTLIINQDKTTALMQKDVENINDTTKKTEEKVDVLIKNRIEDQYIKPNKKYENFIGHVAYVVIGFLIPILIMFLFPHLRG